MAKVTINGLRKKKLPKQPKLNSSKKVWDAHEKKKKEVISYNKAVDTEKARRERIKALGK